MCRFVLLSHNYAVVRGWVEFCWVRDFPWVMDLNLFGWFCGGCYFDDVKIVFTAFVVSWVIPSAHFAGVSFCLTHSVLLWDTPHLTFDTRVGFVAVCSSVSMLVGPCHYGMARPRVADRGTASDKEGSCE